MDNGRAARDRGGAAGWGTSAGSSLLRCSRRLERSNALVSTTCARDIQTQHSFISRLRHNDGWVTSDEEKENIVREHFSRTLGKAGRRQEDFNWQDLNVLAIDLRGIDGPFTEEEVKGAIKSLPSYKASRSDGFIASSPRVVLMLSLMMLLQPSTTSLTSKRPTSGGSTRQTLCSNRKKKVLRAFSTL